MKTNLHKIFSLFLLICSSNALRAQSDHFAYAVTAIAKDGKEWTALRRYNTQTGEFSSVLLDGSDKSIVIYDAVTKKETGNYSKDGGPYVCVVYGGQAVAGGMVVNSKSFHEKPDKKHPDKPSKLGESLLNYCDTIGRVSGWKDVTNEVQAALGRQ